MKILIFFGILALCYQVVLATHCSCIADNAFGTPNPLFPTPTPQLATATTFADCQSAKYRAFLCAGVTYTFETCSVDPSPAIVNSGLQLQSGNCGPIVVACTTSEPVGCPSKGAQITYTPPVSGFYTVVAGDFVNCAITDVKLTYYSNVVPKCANCNPQSQTVCVGASNNIQCCNNERTDCQEGFGCVPKCTAQETRCHTINDGLSYQPGNQWLCCTSNEECCTLQGTNFVCNQNEGACIVKCNQAGETRCTDVNNKAICCSNGQKCLLGHGCKQCITNSDCVGNPSGPVCNTNRNQCVDCNTSTDCPSGRTCHNNHCVVVNN